MKIVFICGSLEPGRDGIGDYVRLLATGLLGNGHEVGALALNDPHITKKNDGWQLAGHLNLQVLRLPAVMPEPERFALGKEWIDKFDPEWLSLQFVTFAFHPKGLTLGLSTRLKKLGQGRHWHFMMHELWVGMNLESSRKLIWWGRMQRLLIKSLLRKVKPDIIHTQTRFYLQQLQKLGQRASYLPLFSNIPAQHEGLVIERKWQSMPGEPVRIVVFGSIHPGASIAAFAADAARFAATYKTRMILQFVGRCGAEQEHWLNVWTSGKLESEVLGEQPVGKISEILRNATVGLTSSALPLIDKSGAVAAMREHDLPVICIASPWTPRGLPAPGIPADIIEFNGSNLGETLLNTIQLPAANTAAAVSAQLEQSLLALNLKPV